MTLPNTPERYNQTVEAERNRALEAADRQNIKRQADIELVSGAKLILLSPDGTRWNITVANDGTLAAVAL